MQSTMLQRLSAFNYLDSYQNVIVTELGLRVVRKCHEFNWIQNIGVGWQNFYNEGHAEEIKINYKYRNLKSKGYRTTKH